MSTPKPDTDGVEVFDAITVGETMAAFLLGGERCCHAPTVVGAESNVAVGMAQLGCRTRWVSRLGDDALGQLVSETVQSHGVDVQVTWDPTHPTGLLVKELLPMGTRVRYYRSESAARYLSESDLRHVGAARWIHLTGITPALSATAADLVTAIATGRTGHAGRLSFDVNYRAPLWADAAQAASVIVPLARRADIVFVGADEAEALMGTSDPDKLATKLLTRTDQEVVVKRGADHASVVTLAGEVTEPAFGAEVVDLTGAGDAFAAGYLAATCWGWDARERLRLGHLLGARAVSEVSDHGSPLAPEALAQLRLSPAMLASLGIMGSSR